MMRQPAHNLRGQSAELAPLLHELTLYCTEPPMDSGHITAPVYVYLGLQDDVLSSVNPDDWYSAYPNADVTVRTYPDGGHDVQYRHLDQILLDISGRGSDTGLRERTTENDRPLGGEPHGASLGLCAWQN